MRAARYLRLFLDGLYLSCGVLAGVFLATIAVLILLQAGGRWMGISLPGLAEYAGYSMAAGSFLALAYTFKHKGHIRVSLFIERLSGTARRWAEIWCLGVGTFLAAYFAWYSIRMVQVSHMIRDISQGADATPLWIPQLGMAVGTTVFALALADDFVRVLLGYPVGEEGSERASAEEHME